MNKKLLVQLTRKVERQKKQIYKLKHRLKIAEESLSADGRDHMEVAINRIIAKMRVEGTD